MTDLQTTTCFDLPGHRVVRNLGVVRGITVRSRSIVGTIGGSLQTLFGGNIPLFTGLCVKTRAEAFERMVPRAKPISANAMACVLYDATGPMQAVPNLLCCGTAVVVQAE